MLIDTHCHLDSVQFKGEIGNIVDRAKQAGLSALQTICTKIEEFEDIYHITKNQSLPIFCSIGTHPLNVMDTKFYDAHYIIKECSRDRVIGIGETGFDYYYIKEEKAKILQKQSFIEHIIAAQETGLPLIIHTREADDDTITILEQHKKKKDFDAVMHCFTSSEKLAFKSLDLGFYISSSGITTFKNAAYLQDLFKKIPLNRLLIETDAPFLAPHPMRGKRNEPSYVKYTAEFLAGIRGENYIDFCTATSNNFFRLFKKARLPS